MTQPVESENKLILSVFYRNPQYKSNYEYLPKNKTRAYPMFFCHKYTVHMYMYILITICDVQRVHMK